MIDFRRHRERFEDALGDVALPEMALVEREPRTPPPLGDIAAAVGAALRDLPSPRGRVAVAVGSRGIARLPEFVRAVVAELRRRGAEPYVVPAMGSHGASTAAGQVDVLAHLGVTDASVGAPIRATMETRVVGHLPNGLPVYAGTDALDADAIVVVNRVKPHTSFRGEYESGAVKMLAVGLGKLDGARSLHSQGWGGMRANVPAAARVVIATGKVAFAVAILENADEQPCAVYGIPANELLEREPALLEAAKTNLARLPFERIDVLVVDRVGKTISGGGGDPNVTGRFPSEYISGGPAVTRLVYLALTADGDGNANGIGLADVVSEELAAGYDPLPTYMNALTTTAAGNARLPMVMPTKRLAVAAALRMCPGLDDTSQALVVRIADTLHLGRLWLSRAAVAALPEPPRILRDFGPFSFEDYG
jgi:hypothetical protein